MKKFHVNAQKNEKEDEVESYNKNKRLNLNTVKELKVYFR